MKGRYLALVERDAAARPRIERVLEDAERRFNLKPVGTCGPARIYADRDLPVISGPASRVILLGALFNRSGARTAVDTLSAKREQNIVDTCGGVLIDEYWGGYLAFVVAENGGVAVIRDPSGAVGCFRADMDGATCLVSDVEIALALGLALPALDWSCVAQCLAFPITRSDKTCLRDISALLPGMRLRFSGGKEFCDAMWDPWAFASPERQISDAERAAAMLVSEVSACTLAWAAQARHLLLELSGGLDSSILAACLARRSGEMTCVNLVCSAPGGDERRYASAVAQQIGAPLRFATLEAAGANLLRAPSIRSPYPDANLLHEMIDDVLTEELKRIGAAAYISGGGGDNVFCFLSTASPAADVLMCRKGLAAFFRTVGDLAALHRCTAWTAARFAVRKAWRAGIAHQPRRDLFMSREALKSQPVLHPWHAGPRGALPGKREHVVSIAFGLWNTDTTERSRIAPVRYPLLSQPVVELCLRIPSWMWVTGGRNRALARDAFRSRLPELVANRRTKGDLTGFMAEVFRQNRPLVRALLLDGRLAREGVIDRKAVERCLSAENDPDQMERGRLLALAKTEVWAGSWQA